jgi:hypothetical protein
MITAAEFLKQATKDAWICRSCYDKLKRDIECFTDVNLFNHKCAICGEKADNHICDGGKIEVSKLV